MLSRPKKAQLRATRRRPDRDERPDIDPDYHWNSFVPHLLAVATRAAYRTIHTQAGIQNPITPGKPHPTRQSFGTTRRIRRIRKPLGLNP